MKPSPTELALLKQLWAAGAQSARELHDGVSGSLNWTFSSTRRTLDRMIDKGLVSVSERHGVRVYEAATAKVDTLAALARDFMTNVLELDAPLAASAFTGSALLSEDEIDELERLLQQTNEGKGE